MKHSVIPSSESSLSTQGMPPRERLLGMKAKRTLGNTVGQIILTLIVGNLVFADADKNVGVQNIADANVRQSKHTADTGGHHLLAFPNQTEDCITIKFGEICGTADHAVENLEFAFSAKSHH